MGIALSVITRVRSAFLTLSVCDKPLAQRLIEAHYDLHGVIAADFPAELRDHYRALCARLTAGDEPVRGGYDATLTVWALSDGGRFEVAQEFARFVFAVARFADLSW